MSALTNDQQKFIEDVAKQNGFTNFEIENKGGTTRGDNYMGVVKFVKIIEKNSDKELNLVLKTAFASETLRKQFPLDKAYLREIFMYAKVFPQLISLQKEHNIKHPFNGFAKLYGTLEEDYNESLLLEDLRDSNFKLYNRKMPMNSSHVELVLRSYARYHAISFALKDLYPEKLEDLTKHLTDIFEDDMPKNEIFQKYISTHCQKGYAAVGDNEAARKAVENFENNAFDFFFNELKREEYKLVILHGDCWCNNMMFQYEDPSHSQEPTRVCFLDFQLSKMGSPVTDIAYFFYVSAPKHILSDVDKYLKIYHDSLSENIREFGCDPEKLYPWATFKDQWQKLAKIGLLLAFTVIPLMLSEAEDSINLAEVADSGKELWDDFTNSNVLKDKADILNKRFYDVITSMIDSKVL